MEIKKYISLSKLETFLDLLQDLFATKEIVADIEADTNTYILNVDYSTLEFDTSEIVG